MPRAPHTLAEQMSVRDAIRFFEAEARHRSYPVIDGESGPLGLASRADALRWRQAEIDDATLDEQVSDRSMPVVHPDSPASEVANLMISEDIGRVCGWPPILAG